MSNADPGAAQCAIQKYWKTTTTPPPPADYPPPSAIPRTTPPRLEQSSPSAPSTTEPNTVLYLAYGSNLSAETFLGVRGIRPLSQINVSAPSLRLTFDLPGLPYQEPCFANTAPRKLPKPPRDPLPDPRDPIPPPQVPEPGPVPIPGKPSWDKGLVGVVYEVTKEDYAKIVATEGGGASYKEIVVPCLAIPPRMNIPERPPGEDIPRPFLARTLYAPNIPDAPDDGNKDGDKPGEPGDDDPDPRKKWWWKFVKRPHREEDYAQPSARYLKLITDGAREHDLPEEYQKYLNSLQPYTITSRRQTIGQYLMLVLCAPAFLILRYLAGYLADENGRLPTWMGIAMGAWFNLIWILYDGAFKPLFGDGERTEDEEDEERAKTPRRCWRTETGWVDEKRCLLRDLERNGGA